MDLIKKLEDAVQMDDGNGHRGPKTAWWPSELGKCRRALWYRLNGTGASNPIEPNALVKMRLGDSIHATMIDLLAKVGVEIADEVRFEKPYPGMSLPMRGRVDALIVDEDGTLAVVEAKSSFGRGIVEMRKTGLPRRPDLLQLVAGMDGADLVRGYLVYIARDSAYFTQFLVEKTGQTTYLVNGAAVEVDLAEVVERLASVEQATEAPARDYVHAIKNGEMRDEFQKAGVKYKTAWQCGYCGWRALCWAPEVERLAEGDNADAFAAIHEPQES
jgi:hypothetical protein